MIMYQFSSDHNDLPPSIYLFDKAMILLITLELQNVVSVYATSHFVMCHSHPLEAIFTLVV